MPILVTGSSGHLGEALVRTLRAHGEEVISCDIKPGAFTSDVGSITDQSFVDRLVARADGILHAATLHKPHVVTHSRQDFIDTNISGTQALLDAAKRFGVERIVFTSTTSAFGDAMSPGMRNEAVWVTEALSPIPKNIYGITKLAAENLCQLAHRKDGLNCVVLRTSRFFPEDDDSKSARDRFHQDNLKLVELLYRRVDIEDCVDAHIKALSRAPDIGFGTYIVSATTPLQPADAQALHQSLPSVLRHYCDYEDVFRERGWHLPESIDRVYDNSAARAALNWTPVHSFSSAIERLRRGEPLASPLAQHVGAKGYHDRAFTDGPFPTD